MSHQGSLQEEINHQHDYKTNFSHQRGTKADISCQEGHQDVQSNNECSDGYLGSQRCPLHETSLTRGPSTGTNMTRSPSTGSHLTRDTPVNLSISQQGNATDISHLVGYLLPNCNEEKGFKVGKDIQDNPQLKSSQQPDDLGKVGDVVLCLKMTKGRK